MLKLGAVSVAVVTLAVLASADAQTAVTSTPAAVTRTTLQTVDVPNSNYEVIFDLMDISPGKVARHTHPGPALVYVLEGGFTFLLDGHPPRIFQAGDSFQKPAGAAHEGFGDSPSRIMVVFVVPKGAQLITPAQ